MVKKFFKDIREHKSLADHKTRSWLGNLPFYIPEDAIPLFVDGDDHGDDSVDYQLHPHFTLLELGKTATQPHAEFFRLSIDGNTLEDPNLVIGIGRLFVNVSNGRAERTSKWTGYEVFVDKELALWMVFDRLSIDPRAADWYPLSCRLSYPILQDSDDKQRVLSYVSKVQHFDIACFLPSLRDLADAEFKTASEKVREKFQSGKMRVCEVEQSEIDKLLETESAPQKVLEDIRKQLHEAILNAVSDGRRTAQKIADLLDKYKDNFSMIRKVITEEVAVAAAENEGCGGQIMTILLDQLKDEVSRSISTRVIKAAAGNQAYGEQIMTMLLDQLKDEVCKSISSGVVKAAAANWRYGAQIMEKLLKVCGDVVCEKISLEVICAAARNEHSGAPILDSLLKANEEKVLKLILEVFSKADRGEDWLAMDLQGLKKRLEEIPYTIGYPVTGGIQAEQHSVGQQRHGVKVKQR